MNTLTYLSIGSCPHAITIADLNEKSDQMVPKFLRSHILNGECVNVILIEDNPQLLIKILKLIKDNG